jgi:hypothetical protein
MFALSAFQMRSPSILQILASNCYPPDLNLQGGWDYRCTPPHLGVHIFLFLHWILQYFFWGAEELMQIREGLHPEQHPKGSLLLPQPLTPGAPPGPMSLR